MKSGARVHAGRPGEGREGGGGFLRQPAASWRFTQGQALNVERIPNVDNGTMDLKFDVEEGQTILRGEN